jgi:ribosomal protein S12 methylthiotransferase
MSISVSLVSLGCSKNLVDGESMLYSLQEKGYQIVTDPAASDVIIVNTCGFIEPAQRESVETILEMSRYREGGRLKALIVTGCMSQLFGTEVLAEMPEVNAILGTGSYEKITDAVEEALSGHVFSSFDNIDDHVIHSPSRVLTTPSHTAFLKIAEGCDNCCTYCIIPSLRGRFRSRTEESILEEAKTLAQKGVKELIVVAQDTTRYGLDLYGEYRIAPLLRKLCKIEGIRWVRLHYSYPDKITDELLTVMAEEEKVANYLDIPVQHSSSSVLARMNRKGDGPYLRKLFARIRKTLPDVCLRTSLITGFPGESEEDFLDLCTFVEEIGFDRLGVFPFSPQEGTPAFTMEDPIDEVLKKERQEILMNIQSRISEKTNQEMVGSSLLVLCEEITEDGYAGRSYRDSPDVDPKVFFTSETPVAIGDFVPVIITDCDSFDLFGKALINPTSSTIK